MPSPNAIEANGEPEANNADQPIAPPNLDPPNLNEIDLDGFNADDVESIADLMVRYEVEPDAGEVEESEESTDGLVAEKTPSDAAVLTLEPQESKPENTDDDLAAIEEQIELANQLYLTGRQAFESGYYRQAIANLERAAALSVGVSPSGGEIKIWLVLAYQAYGNVEAALSLCRKLTHHPHIPTRQQGRRLRAILEAPELAKRPEWFSEIPDLSEIEDSEGEAKKGSSGTYKPRPIRPIKEPEIDPATINRRDNQFIGVAIAVVLALLIYNAIG